MRRDGQSNCPLIGGRPAEAAMQLATRQEKRMQDWNQLDEQFGPQIWATAYRILGNHADALDCCQDVLVEAGKRADDKKVRNWPAFVRWLTARRALDRARQRKSE